MELIREATSRALVTLKCSLGVHAFSPDREGCCLCLVGAEIKIYLSKLWTCSHRCTLEVFTQLPCTARLNPIYPFLQIHATYYGTAFHLTAA